MASAPTAAIGGSGGSGFSYQASQAMMQRPWYKALLASWGNPKTLNDSQKTQLVSAVKRDTQLAQQFPVITGNIEASDHGMIQPKGTFVRDALIAGAVMGGAFALPALAGAGGAATAPTAAASSAAAPSAAASVLPSTVIGTGEIGPIAGGTGMAGSSGGRLLGLLKTAFDNARQAKDIYDSAGNLIKGGSQQTNAGAVGQAAGNIEATKLKALNDEGKLTQQQDVNAQSRAKLALDAPNLEARNSVRGDILANAQDAHVSGLPDYIHVGQVSGGLRPSMLSASSRALGANMSRNALANNISGKDVPDLTPLPQASAYDDILSGVSQGGAFWNALGKVRTPSQTTSGASSPGTGPQQGQNIADVQGGAGPDQPGGINTNPLDPSQLPGLQPPPTSGGDPLAGLTPEQIAQLLGQQPQQVA